MADTSSPDEHGGVPGLPAGESGDQRTVVEVGVHKRPLVQWIAQVGAVLVAMVIVILVLQMVYGQDTSHEDLSSRLDVLEQESHFQSCLLQFIPEERSESVIAECAISEGLG